MRQYRVYEQDGQYLVKLINNGHSAASVAFAIEAMDSEIAEFMVDQLNRAYEYGWEDSKNLAIDGGGINDKRV